MTITQRQIDHYTEMAEEAKNAQKIQELRDLVLIARDAARDKVISGSYFAGERARFQGSAAAFQVVLDALAET